MDKKHQNFLTERDKEIINQALEGDFTAIDAELELMGYDIEEINAFCEEMHNKITVSLKNDTQTKST